MCRIYGSFGGPAAHGDVLRNVARELLHGGPDDQTVLTGSNWALGNNRLAIQGIHGGKQPFRLGRLTCVFNGEVYNHRALRAGLEAEGHVFGDDCDGNVILPLYERHGDAFVQKLEGMFAIAIVDERNKPCLKLFNDHAGMKSLYYFVSADGRELCFASELRALARFPRFPDQIDPLAIDRYFGGKAVWGPGTIYSRVRTLAPGTILTLEADGRPSERLYSLPSPDPWHRGERARPDAARTLDNLLRNELRNMLDADVPVCVVTSGGLDSSYITALAKTLVPELASFNISYKGEWPSDERHFAQEVARHCGTNHHQVLLDPGDFPIIIDRFIGHLDQPNNAPHSLSTYALFEAIHDAGFKVALTGDGADELFGGYARFVNASADHSADWQSKYQRTMAVMPAAALSELYSPAYRSELEKAGGLFTDRVGMELARRVEENRRDKLEDLLRYDQFERFPYYILRRVDHLSMAHAVEARIPFLQPKIMQFAASLPAELKVVQGKVKTQVADAASAWIPASIIDRPKQPFTLPIAAMIKSGEALHDMIGDTLLSPNLRCSNYFDGGTIKDLFDRQTHQPNAQAADALWSLLMLETWLGKRNIHL